MYHNTVNSNPKYATTRWCSLAKTYKSVMNHIFMMNKIIKKKQTFPFFAPPRRLRSGGAKMGMFFFLNKYKIKYSDFITILGSVGTKGMMPATNLC